MEFEKKIDKFHARKVGSHNSHAMIRKAALFSRGVHAASKWKKLDVPEILQALWNVAR
jgi:hypothetical protein